MQWLLEPELDDNKGADQSRTPARDMIGHLQGAVAELLRVSPQARPPQARLLTKAISSLMFGSILSASAVLARPRFFAASARPAGGVVAESPLVDRLRHIWRIIDAGRSSRSGQYMTAASWTRPPFGLHFRDSLFHRALIFMTSSNLAIQYSSRRRHTLGEPDRALASDRGSPRLLIGCSYVSPAHVYLQISSSKARTDQKAGFTGARNFGLWIVDREAPETEGR